MDNKTKVKVAVVIGIVILAVIFIIMVVFVKDNRTPVNKNIPTKGKEGYVDTTKNTIENSTSDNQVVSSNKPANIAEIVSLGIKDNNLVEIKSDLSSTVVKNLPSGYKEYCFGENKVYLISDNENRTSSIVEIDLKNNYSEKTITTDEYEGITNIEYYSGKLYFVSGMGQLIEYSISENVARALTNENEISSFTINKEKNNIILSYRPNGTNPGIYVFDFTTNSIVQIVTLNELAGKLALNGNTLVIDVKEYNTLYVYDMEKNTVVAIGADNIMKKADNHFTFYDNVLLCSDGDSVSLKDVSGESYKDNWYVLNDKTIADISMLDSTKLQISRYGENGIVSRSIVIDLSNGVTTEMPDVVYNEVVRIK